MNLQIILISFIISFSHALVASEPVKDISFYKRVEAKDNRIHLIADLKMKTITVTNLKVNHDLPIGNIKLNFPKPYTVKIQKTEVTKSGEVIISGNDYYDGIGTKITLSFFAGIENATVIIESQFEEISLYFAPQLLTYKVN